MVTARDRAYYSIDFEGLTMLYGIIINYNLRLRTIVLLVHYSADGEV